MDATSRCRELFKILPDEIRANRDETGTVITVPAAFNQMQNAATVDAAKMAGFGNVALMQEPVAAILRVMKDNQSDGNFLLFDLGGGTLDVSVAERISGKVNFLANGGLTMCGGRDFDRILFDKFVVPWLEDNYSLPDKWQTLDKYKKLCSIATHASEDSKIELSSSDETTITGETGFKDENGGRFKSGGTTGVTRNVFANSALSPRRILTAKNFTARQKSGSFLFVRVTKVFSNVGTRRTRLNGINVAARKLDATSRCRGDFCRSG